MAETRSFNLHDVLSYELGPLPWSLALSDGGLVKTSKSKLLQFLELQTSAKPVKNIPAAATLIRDGMARLQSLS